MDMKKGMESLTAHLSPEDELLVCCARTSVNSETSGRIKALLRGGLDWNYLVQAARRHGVRPLLYHNLKVTCSEGIPKPVLGHLRQCFQANAQRNLFITGKLLRLLDLLGRKGISAVSVRGPVLAMLAYGDPVLRESPELDIFVRRGNVLEAKDLLVLQEYQVKVPKIELTEAQKVSHLESGHHYGLVRDKEKGFLELQWGLTDRYFSFPFDPEYLWKGLESVELAGKTITGFSWENLLLISYMQGTKRCWRQLGSICDIAELVRAHPGMRWEKLIGQAHTLSSRRMLFLSLLLASDLLDASLPTQLRALIRADQTVKSLALEVCRWLFRHPYRYRGTFNRYFFHLRVRERFRDRVWWCIRLALIITAEDWAFLPVPSSLSFLYYVLRPMRILRKYGLAPWKRWTHFLAGRGTC